MTRCPALAVIHAEMRVDHADVVERQLGYKPQLVILVGHVGAMLDLATVMLDAVQLRADSVERQRGGLQFYQEVLADAYKPLAVIAEELHRHDDTKSVPENAAIHDPVQVVGHMFEPIMHLGKMIERLHEQRGKKATARDLYLYFETAFNTGKRLAMLAEEVRILNGAPDTELRRLHNPAFADTYDMHNGRITAPGAGAVVSKSKQTLLDFGLEAARGAAETLLDGATVDATTGVTVDAGIGREQILGPIMWAENRRGRLFQIRCPAFVDLAERDLALAAIKPHLRKMKIARYALSMEARDPRDRTEILVTFTADAAGELIMIVQCMHRDAAGKVTRLSPVQHIGVPPAEASPFHLLLERPENVLPPWQPERVH